MAGLACCEFDAGEHRQLYNNFARRNILQRLASHFDTRVDKVLITTNIYSLILEDYNREVKSTLIPSLDFLI